MGNWEHQHWIQYWNTVFCVMSWACDSCIILTVSDLNELCMISLYLLEVYAWTLQKNPNLLNLCLLSWDFFLSRNIFWLPVKWDAETGGKVENCEIGQSQFTDNYVSIGKNLNEYINLSIKNSNFQSYSFIGHQFYVSFSLHH